MLMLIFSPRFPPSPQKPFLDHPERNWWWIVARALLVAGVAFLGSWLVLFFVRFNGAT